MRPLAILTGFAPDGYEWLIITIFLACAALVVYVAVMNRR